MLLSFQRPPCSRGGASATSNDVPGMKRAPAQEAPTTGAGQYSAAAVERKGGSSAGGQAPEAALADLEHCALEAVHRQIELVGPDRVSVEPHPALGQ